MRWLKLISLSVVTLVCLVAAIACIRGNSLPIHHSTTAAAEIAAPPEKVWQLITAISAQPTWRTGLLSIESLPLESGKEHWREHLAHNQTMDFIADETVPGSRRAVRLDLPNGSYTGSWIYVLTPTAAPGSTHVTITENGDIYPPVYRTLMHDVIGMRSNLDRYLSDLQNAARKN